MRVRTMQRFFLSAAAAVLVGIIALAQGTSVVATRIALVHDSSGFSAYLVDQESRAVYFSLNDRDGRSVCSAVCLRTWSPLAAGEDLEIGEGLDPSAFGSIELSDGTSQLTYYGRPLYVLANAELAKGTSSHGTGGLWFLIGPDGEKAAASQDAAGPADNVPTDVGTGWFTAEQAQRGKRAYEANCAVCHHVSLLGEQYAPALKGSSFLRKWAGQSVGDLFMFVSEQMPLTAPGSLTDQQYIDIVAYVLSQNDLPAGGTELPPAPDQLSGLPLPAATE